MKVTKTLNVSAQAIYNKLIETTRADIKQSIHKDLELKQGLKYRKKIMSRQGVEVPVDVEVKTLIPNEQLETDIYYREGIYQITYTLEALEENITQVTYEENFLNEKKLVSLNQKLMEFVMGLSLKKKVKQQLTNLEHEILGEQQ